MTIGWEIEPLDNRLAGCLHAATLAPSVHNSQPWLLRLSPQHIDVCVDPTRRLEVIDPTGREAWISVGAAILNLRIAILHAGRVAHTMLLPDRQDPYLAARITIGTPRPADATVRALASAISRRRTNRRPFRHIPVRPEVIEQLAAAARVEGGQLMEAIDTDRTAVLALVRTANERLGRDQRYIDELRHWTNGSAPVNDGIPAASFGPTDDTAVLPLRDMGIAHPGVPRRHAMFESAPTVVVLYTAGDGPLQWLRAGQAMQRVLLTATVRGVSTTPMTAPTELPDLRELLSGTPDTKVAQVVLRLGYGNPVPATPRRPLADILTTLTASRIQ